MELRVLQYFLAVTREQSISGAAEALHLSQPTLSRQLREMEEELGKQLISRGRRRRNRRCTLSHKDCQSIAGRFSGYPLPYHKRGWYKCA